MARRRAQAIRPLRRRIEIRKPKKTLLIFCEGERTEPEYLHALKTLPEVRDTAAVDLRIEMSRGGSVPFTLVTMAVDAKTRLKEVDEFWCVFDVEWPRNHPRLADAVQLAEDNGISLAISNPCFELWLVLHFSDHNAWLNNRDARHRRQGLDGWKGKGLDVSSYMPRRHDAVARAAWLEKNHHLNDTKFPDDNPSSGMFRLLQSVK